MATAPIKQSATESTPSRPRGGPQHEPLEVPRFTALPTFGDPKPKKRPNKARSSIPWARIWDRITHPSFPWIALGSVSAGLAIVLVWHRRVASAPEYAVAQVALAIRSHNGTKLAYYADGAAIVDQVVDEATDWLVAHRGLTVLDGIDGVADARRRDAKIQAAKSALAARLSRSLGSALISRQSDSTAIADRVVRLFAALPPLADVVGDDHLDVTGIGPPDLQEGGGGGGGGGGQFAELPFTLQYRELEVDIPISLTLRRVGTRWKIVGVGGVEAALDQINTAQLERLAIANRAVAQRLASMVDVGPLSVQQTARRRRRPATYQLQVPLTNRSSQQIMGVALGLHPRSNDSHATVLQVQHPIAVGETSTEVWQFDKATATGTHMTAPLEHPDRYAILVRNIVVDSGGQPDTVRMLRSYREIQ